jgi:copper chaperone
MLVLKVAGMDCRHCVDKVTEAVQFLSGVDSVEVDLPAGEVRIEGDVDRFAATHAIEQKGYQVTE